MTKRQRSGIEEDDGAGAEEDRGTRGQEEKKTSPSLHIATTAAENVPVHVTNGQKALAAHHTADIAIFVDASIWGWGAVILGDRVPAL